MKQVVLIALALGILSMCYGAIPVYTEESVRSTVTMSGTYYSAGGQAHCDCTNGGQCICHYEESYQSGTYPAFYWLQNGVYHFKCGVAGDGFCTIYQKQPE